MDRIGGTSVTELEKLVVDYVKLDFAAYQAGQVLTEVVLNPSGTLRGVDRLSEEYEAAKRAAEVALQRIRLFVKEEFGSETDVGTDPQYSEYLADREEATRDWLAQVMPELMDDHQEDLWLDHDSLAPGRE